MLHNGTYVNSFSSVQDATVSLYALRSENIAGTIYFRGSGYYYLSASGGNDNSCSTSASGNLPSGVVIEIDMECGGSNGGSGPTNVGGGGTIEISIYNKSTGAYYKLLKQ